MTEEYYEQKRLEREQSRRIPNIAAKVLLGTLMLPVAPVILVVLGAVYAPTAYRKVAAIVKKYRKTKPDVTAIPAAS